MLSTWHTTNHEGISLWQEERPTRRPVTHGNNSPRRLLRRKHNSASGGQATTEDKRLHACAGTFAVGKVVEALGLLDVETGELETIVKLGMEARTQGDAPARFAPPAQGA